jgi:hypothetical protein
MNVNQTERGWPGHFICGTACVFRRNTLVEALHQDGRVDRYVVSTVGNYRPGAERKLETIGHERHYETMIFEAEKTGAYWDADTSRQVYLDGPWSLKITRSNRDEIDNLANDMHDANVKELIDAVKLGTVKPAEGALEA